MARPLRAELRVGNDALGVLLGRAPATRTWERADQDLFELFASEIAVAIRNAQLFGQVEAQNAPAPRARCRQGRLPARRQPQPADAADEHPRLCGPAGHRPARPAPGDHLGAIRTTFADGPPAPDRDATRIGRASSKVRGRLAGYQGAQGVGGHRRQRRSLHDRRWLEWLAGHRRRRSAGPGPLGAPRQRGQVRRPHADHGRTRDRRVRIAGCA